MHTFLHSSKIYKFRTNFTQASIEAMKSMTVEEYKSKEIGLVCDLLVSMKLICTGCGNQFTIGVSADVVRYSF